MNNNPTGLEVPPRLEADRSFAQITAMEMANSSLLFNVKAFMIYSILSLIRVFTIFSLTPFSYPPNCISFIFGLLLLFVPTLLPFCSIARGIKAIKFCREIDAPKGTGITATVLGVSSLFIPLAFWMLVIGLKIDRDIVVLAIILGVIDLSVVAAIWFTIWNTAPAKR